MRENEFEGKLNLKKFLSPSEIFFSHRTPKVLPIEVDGNKNFGNIFPGK